MATKPTKLAGKSTTKYLGNTAHTKEYWMNAAKQIVWPVDYDEQHISVPYLELEMAKDNLIVQHFCNNGFHIQSAISVEKTIPFVAPVTPGPIFRGVVIQEEKPKTLYQTGEKFKVRSTECELEIVHQEKGKIHFKYLNRNKPDIISSEEQLTKVIRWQQWSKIY